jgi:hypothetical protein
LMVLQANVINGNNEKAINDLKFFIYLLKSDSLFVCR